VTRLHFHPGERAHRGLPDRSQLPVVLRDVGLQRQRTTTSQLLLLVYARRTYQPGHHQQTPGSAPEASRRPNGNPTLQEEQ